MDKEDNRMSIMETEMFVKMNFSEIDKERTW
jgi:hypothetical protein